MNEVTPIKKPPEKPQPTDPVELLARVNELGKTMREIIVLAKRIPVTAAYAPHQDPVRSLAQAQQYLQTGFMWLRRGIENPDVF